MAEFFPKRQEEPRGDHDNDNEIGFGIDAAVRSAFPFIGGKPLEIPRYLIKGVMPEAGVIVLGGQSRAGKSLTAVDMSLALIYGREFVGRKVKRGGVLWIAAEGFGDVEPRFFAARKMRFNDPSNSALPLQLPNLANIESPSAAKRDTNAILTDLEGMIRAAHGSFADACPRHPLRLVVIDTLSAFFNLEEENSNSEAARVMRRLGDIAIRYNVAIMPVHHFGKEAGTGLRGASAFTAGADAIIVCKASIDEQTGHDNGPRILALTKTRRGEPGPLASYSIKSAIIGRDEDGDDTYAPYVEFDNKGNAVDGKPKKPSLGDLRFAEALDEVMATNGMEYKVRGEGPVVRAVLVQDLRKEFARRYLDDGTGLAKSSERSAWARSFKFAQETRSIAGDQLNSATAVVWRV